MIVEAPAADVAPSVGLLNEGPLHASLRARYVAPGDRVEAALDGYVVDVLRGDPTGRACLIIEIQTGSFAKIARKMRDLVSRYRVRLVYPIPRDLWIVKMPRAPGEPATRRRSPKRRGVIDVFAELVSFPELIAHENFELEVALTEEESVWRFDGRRGWRRRGWVTVERRLLQVHETVSLRNPADFMAVLPRELRDEFLTADIASAIKRPRRVAQQVAYCLRRAGCIEQLRLQGKAIVYGRCAGTAGN